MCIQATFNSQANNISKIMSGKFSNNVIEEMSPYICFMYYTYLKSDINLFNIRTNIYCC